MFCHESYHHQLSRMVQGKETRVGSVEGHISPLIHFAPDHSHSHIHAETHTAYIFPSSPQSKHPTFFPRCKPTASHPLAAIASIPFKLALPSKIVSHDVRPRPQQQDPRRRPRSPQPHDDDGRSIHHASPLPVRLRVLHPGPALQPQRDLGSLQQRHCRGRPNTVTSSVHDNPVRPPSLRLPLHHLARSSQSNEKARRRKTLTGNSVQPATSPASPPSAASSAASPSLLCRQAEEQAPRATATATMAKIRSSPLN